MNDNDIQELKERLRSRASFEESAFDAKWRTVCEDFTKLESGPIGRSASRLVVQLELFRLLCNTFPEADLRCDEEIIGLVVPDAKVIGDQVTMTLRGIQAKVKIVRREISDRFGICYTLEAPDGSRFTREFFD